MNKENAISVPSHLATFPLDLYFPLNLPTEERYTSTDEMGPGFDSTSPSITTCCRFNAEVSYENGIITETLQSEKIDVRNIFRRWPDLFPVFPSKI